MLRGCRLLSFLTMNQDVQNIWATARRRRRLAYKTFEAADYELYDSKVQSFQPPFTELTAVVQVSAENRTHAGLIIYVGARKVVMTKWR